MPRPCCAFFATPPTPTQKKACKFAAISDGRDLSLLEKDPPKEENRPSCHIRPSSRRFPPFLRAMPNHTCNTYLRLARSSDYMLGRTIIEMFGGWVGFSSVILRFDAPPAHERPENIFPSPCVHGPQISPPNTNFSQSLRSFLLYRLVKCVVIFYFHI